MNDYNEFNDYQENMNNISKDDKSALKSAEKERKRAEEKARQAEKEARQAERRANKAENKAKRNKGTWKFFLGFFVGFVATIGALVGVGFYAYNNVSLTWINKTFKTDISVSKEFDNKKLKELIASAINIATDYENITIAQIESDFGLSVPNEISGIDITDLKGEKLKNISIALEKKFDSITAEELNGVIQTDDIKFLDMKMRYYIKAGEGTVLYKDASYSTAVNQSTEFKYEIENGWVYVKDVAVSKIEDYKVEIAIRDLPLKYALGDFTNNLGDNITIGELEDLGVDVSYFGFSANDKKKTLNELEDVIKTLKIANLLDFTIGANEEVYKNGTEKVTGVLAVIAKKSIDEISTFDFQTLTLKDVFGEVSGALTIVNENTQIGNLSTELTNAMKTTSISTLASKGIISVDSQDLNKTVPNTITGGYAGKKLGELTLTELFDIIPQLFVG